MGLDSVELVMKVEEHFDVSIPDADASTLGTVGLLHNWVVNELRRLNRPNVDSTTVFYELRDLILRIPRDGEQCFHGIVNTDSTAT